MAQTHILFLPTCQLLRTKVRVPIWDGWVEKKGTDRKYCLLQVFCLMVGTGSSFCLIAWPI